MNSEWSFQLGYNQLKRKDLQEARMKLSEAMGIRPTNRPSFSRRKNGKFEHLPSKRKAIEAVFAQYGIKKVWGFDPAPEQ